MRLFALIDGNVVANVIVAAAWPGGIDVTDIAPRPGPGWTYDGVVFSPPPVTPAPPEPPPITHSTRMTRSAFLSRLTLAEHVAIESAMPTDVTLRVAKQRFDAARIINVALPDAAQFVGYLVQAGHILPSRVATILSPIPLTTFGAVHPQTGAVTGDTE